jgi:hypothetical protein
MRLIGELRAGNRILKSVTKENNDNKDFRKELEKLLIGVCKELHIPVPIWLTKNTQELGRYRKTTFYKDQFIGDTSFEEFVIKLEIEE